MIYCLEEELWVLIVLQDRYPTPSVLTVRDMRAHSGQSFQGREALACPAVFGCIDDLSLLIQVTAYVLENDARMM